jgi:hypothetical protein
VAATDVTVGRWPCPGVSVVEPLELAEGVEQVPLIPDQGPVQQIMAAGLHPPLQGAKSTAAFDAVFTAAGIEVTRR